MVCNYSDIFLEMFVVRYLYHFSLFIFTIASNQFDCANIQVCVFMVVLVRYTRYVINWDGNRNGL